MVLHRPVRGSARLLGSWRILECLVWPPELGRGCSKAVTVAQDGGDGISQACP